MSDECQFLMSICDHEKEEYIKSRERKGNPLREHQLLGRWRAKGKGDRGEKREDIYEFLKDHTATFTTTSYVSSHTYIGNIITRQITHGTWTLQGDSVLITQQPELQYAIDTTGISYRAEFKPAIQDVLDEWKTTFKQRQDEARAQGEQPVKYGAAIDESETKIKWNDKFFTKQ